MTGYPDEMLARQALAAGNQQAAERLLRRLRPLTAGVETAAEEADDTAGFDRAQQLHSVRMQQNPAVRNPETQAEAFFMDAEEMTDVTHQPEALLLQRLATLAGAADIRVGEPEDAAGLPWDNTERASTALRWMERRLSRATAEFGQTAAQTLPADGARDMAPGGTADAAALSRLYERDARRYDSCFELPL